MLIQLAKDIFHLFFPKLCIVCSNSLLQSEYAVCRPCLNELPKTNFEQQPNNPIEQKFWGKIPLHHACAIYYFNKKSSLQKILHALKYKQDKEAGLILGQEVAKHLSACSWIQEIDYLMPVPLHPRKLKERGYNQSEVFAQGIHEVIQIPILRDVLLRHRHTGSQASLNLIQRMDNVKGAFELKNSSCVQDKHVLLIDDVMTTGATLEACALTLLQQPGVKISVLTIAYAID